MVSTRARSIISTPEYKKSLNSLTKHKKRRVKPIIIDISSDIPTSLRELDNDSYSPNRRSNPLRSDQEVQVCILDESPDESTDGSTFSDDLPDENPELAHDPADRPDANPELVHDPSPSLLDYNKKVLCLLFDNDAFSDYVYVYKPVYQIRHKIQQHAKDNKFRSKYIQLGKKAPKFSKTSHFFVHLKCHSHVNEVFSVSFEEKDFVHPKSILDRKEILNHINNCTDVYSYFNYSWSDVYKLKIRDTKQDKRAPPVYYFYCENILSELIKNTKLPIFDMLMSMFTFEYKNSQPQEQIS